MNDDTREKLSAYLDGALSDADRLAVEVEISRSEEVRLEFEALRAVSAAVKGLPKEKLPDGFMARLDARRFRDGSKPAQPYFILPPSYRPLAFALSSAIVALVVWDKNHVPSDALEPKIGWASQKVAVKNAAEAPSSIDVSGQLSALDAGGAGGGAPKDESFDGLARKDDVRPKGADSASTFGKHLNAPGKPVEIAEEPAPAFSRTPSAAPAAPAPASEGTLADNGAVSARSEEERSAINERLYKSFEAEKKRMGIARILEPESESDDKKLSAGGREMMALQASPEAARLGRASIVSSVRGSAGAKAKREGAPVLKALALRSADALYTAWAAAGLPGAPPTINFPEQMAIFLAGPQGSGIVSVQHRRKFIVVLYKDAGFEDSSARVHSVPFSAKPVVVKLAE